MKIKIFTSFLAKQLKRKVNKFITRKDIEVINMEFQAHFWGYAVMVTYKSSGIAEEEIMRVSNA